MSWRTRGCAALSSGGSVTTFAPNRQEQTMRVDVMQHYGFTQPLSHAGYYETAHHRQLMIDIKSAILEGHLIALCGVIGSGKTVTLRRLHQQLKEENRVLVAKSLAVEKHRITLGTLITALFYDLSTEKPLRIPTQSEKRERDLRDLVKKGKRPVVLFVDEAHDLTRHTLTDLKRLLEVGYQTGEQPISAGMVDTVLSQQFDDLEPTLTRHGYHLSDLVQQFDAKPTEIKACSVTSSIRLAPPLYEIGC